MPSPWFDDRVGLDRQDRDAPAGTPPAIQLDG
jgi:hypothetical protein